MNNENLDNVFVRLPLALLSIVFGTAACAYGLVRALEAFTGR